MMSVNITALWTTVLGPNSSIHYREHENQTLQILSTNGRDFEAKLAKVSKNVTKLVLKVVLDDITVIIHETNASAEDVFLNLTKLINFVNLTELWLLGSSNQSTFDVVELKFDTRAFAKIVHLTRLHFILPTKSVNGIKIRFLRDLTLLDFADSGNLMEQLLRESIAHLRKLRVLSAPQFWKIRYTYKLFEKLTKEIGVSMLYLELGQNFNNLDGAS